MKKTFLAKDVFVPGGRPTVTYQSRSELEGRLSDHLDFGGNEILSISGPTKTGKTVLVRHVVSDALVIEGGQLGSFDDFCSAILDHFDVPTEVQRSANEEILDGMDRTGRVNVGVASVDQKNASSTKTASGVNTKAVRSPSVATKEALSSGESHWLSMTFTISRKKPSSGLSDF